MSIQNAAITNSTATPIYTSVGNTVISTVHICNNTANNIGCNVYIVQNTFIANGINIIYSNVLVTSTQTLITQEKFALGNGDTIYANASATGLSGTVSYIGI
jgi:hypothetical protein